MITSRSAYSIGLCLLLVIGSAAADVRTFWTRFYNGPGNHSDTAPAVVVDATGDVYVAGASYDPNTISYTLALVKYAADGQLAWQRFTPAAASPDSPPGLALDHAGNVVVTGIGANPAVAAVVRKYSPAGALLVDVQHPVGSTTCWPSGCPALAIDAQDNICLGWVSACDFWVAKFAPDGTFLWHTFFGDADEHDLATDVAVDSAGNVYAVGMLGSGGNGFDVIAYTATGDFLWSDHESGPINSALGPAYVEVDAAGDVVVAATPETGCGVPEIMLWKYTPAGVRLWTRSYPPTPCDSASASALALDSAGNVLITGQVHASSDYVTLKYDPQGTLLWARQHDGPLGSSDVALALAVDEADNVYVTGFESAAGPELDIATIAYDPAGTELWVRTLDVSTNDRGTGIAASAHAVYVAGYAWSATTNDDFVARKYFVDQPGDLNCDGRVSFGDINPFILALTNAMGYVAAYPQCNRTNADVNGDSAVSFGDINPFVLLLAAP